MRLRSHFGTYNQSSGHAPLPFDSLVSGMIDFSFIIAIALTLLFLLWVVWRRETNNASSAGGGLPHPSEYLVCLPERALLDRCLSPEDLEFAAMLRSPGLLGLLVYERRRLALAWLSQTRREAVRL